MNAESTVQVGIDHRGVATVTLNRPRKRNAICGGMIAELSEAAESLASDGSVRTIKLAASGNVFCAGADLDWMREQIDAPREERVHQAIKLATMLDRLNSIGKPVIARVQGSAFGGGLGLLAVCDIVIVNEDARFGLTETRLGLIPATISPFLFAKLGEAGSRRICLTGRHFGGCEAVALGLASRSVSLEELDEAVEDEMRACLACAPRAVAETKSLLRFLAMRDSKERITETAHRLARRWEDPESSEGISAFFEDRKPNWAEDE